MLRQLIMSGHSSVITTRWRSRHEKSGYRIQSARRPKTRGRSSAMELEGTLYQAFQFQCNCRKALILARIYETFHGRPLSDT